MSKFFLLFSFSVLLISFENSSAQSSNGNPQSIMSYQNYDFVPGDSILFEDTFVDAPDGEFPPKWVLVDGQGVINKVNGGDKGFFMTQGNYARFNPRMKKEAYLTDPFTIEFDMFYIEGSYGPHIMLHSINKTQGYDDEAYVAINSSEVDFNLDNGGISLYKQLPEAIANENFNNKWHHIAIAYKNKQMKVYVDQYRVLVVPDTKRGFDKIQYAGIGDDKQPEIIKNVKIASGGNMNMIGKKFTDTKIITHGITFDINKYDIKPESMGTLNMIVQILKDNPEVKFEIDGHTDNSGDHDFNMTLSQHRADAVRIQLINMGVDGSRLTAKGYGDLKPLGSNNTQEAKATNRRVEFIRN